MHTEAAQNVRSRVKKLILPLTHTRTQICKKKSAYERGKKIVFTNNLTNDMQLRPAHFFQRDLSRFFRKMNAPVRRLTIFLQ